MWIVLTAPMLVMGVCVDAAERWLPASWPSTATNAVALLGYVLVVAVPMWWLGAIHAEQRRRHRVSQWFVPSLVNVPPEVDEFEEKAPRGRHPVVEMYMGGFDQLFLNADLRWRLARMYGVPEIERALVVGLQAVWVAGCTLGVAALGPGGVATERRQWHSPNSPVWAVHLLSLERLSAIDVAFLVVFGLVTAAGLWAILERISDEHHRLTARVYGYGYDWNRFSRLVVTVSLLALALAPSPGTPADSTARLFVTFSLLAAASLGAHGVTRRPLPQVGNPPKRLVNELQARPALRRPSPRRPRAAPAPLPGPLTEKLRAAGTRLYTATRPRSGSSRTTPSAQAPWRTKPAPVHPLANADPRRLGRYVLDGWIGQGGFAVVYIGHADTSPERVAIKALRPHLVPDKGERDRFVREGHLLQKAKGEHVAAVLEVGVDQDMPYLVTEYLPGQTLAEYTEAETKKAKRPPTFSQPGPLQTLATHLASALEDCHRAHVVHRDLTPRNVVLTREGAYLIDLGAALALDVSQKFTRTGTYFGVPGYIAPETILGRGTTPASDVWAWACTIVAAVTGRSPYFRQNISAANFATTNDDRTAGSVEAVRAVSPGLYRIVLECLSSDPSARPADGAALRARLRQELASG